MDRGVGRLVLMILALSVGGSAFAAEMRLQVHVGTCDYTYAPAKDYRYTKCTSEALLINEQTSEVFACSAAVEGDQFVAPSVAETAPDTVSCKKIIQAFETAGSYGLQSIDDTAKADRSLNRLQGTYTWKNGFWVFSRQSLDVRFCVQRLQGSGSSVRAQCSKKVEWVKN